MKSKRFVSLSILSFFGVAILGVGGLTVLSHRKNNNKTLVVEARYTPDTHYANGDADTYYSTIDSTKSGNDLLSDLRALNLSKRKKTVGYKSMGTSASSSPYIYTDYDTEDPSTLHVDSNGQVYGDVISSFYTFTRTTSWNKEHVWPNSHGGGSGGDGGTPYPDADIHMPRPTIAAENSNRGNSFFVEGMSSSTSGWDPYSAGYSAQSRGEAARITFYCTVVNANLILTPNNTSPSGTDPVTGKSYGNGHTMGNLETLLSWTINYPINQRERNRNEGAEYLQGNRNPFVDHPEYACKIWGNVNSTTQALCSSATWDTNGVSINRGTAALEVDDTINLIATSTDGSALTWTTSDEQVATVGTTISGSGTEVTITAIGPGTANIKATATINGNPYVAQCIVTVTSSHGGGGGETPVPTGTYDIVPTDLDSAYPSSPKTYASASGVSFTASDVANYSSKVQFKKSSGHLYNNDSLNLATLKLNDKGGTGTITVYAGTAKNPTTTTIEPSDGVYNLSRYNYFKIINNSGNAVTCSSITIGVDDGGGDDEPTLESIAVSTASEKEDYQVGEYFDPTGLEINRYFSDGTDDVYAYENHESEFSFTPSLDTPLSLSDHEIIITYEGLTCSQEIDVTKEVIPPAVLEGISVNTAPTKVAYEVGEYFNPAGLIINRQYSDGTSDTLDYDTNSTGFIFTPDLATPLQTTNTSVTITYAGFECTQTITVSEPVVPVTSVSLNSEYEELHVGDTFQLEATINPSDATDKSVTWTFANYAGYDSVITLSDNGLVTAIGVGMVSVTVTTVDGGKTAECIIEVVSEPTPTPAPRKSGCGGSIVATSVILSTLALTGLSIVLVKRKQK